MTPSRELLTPEGPNSMSSVERFPVQFREIDECPRHFRDRLKRSIDATENVHDIIYSPAFSSGRASLPGSVFCVTDRQWLILQDSKKKGDSVSLKSAVYADTLLIELTDILLYGQLKIDHAFTDRTESSACHFNAAFTNMYTNAIQRVLDFIDDIQEPAVERDKRIRTYLEAWPHKFRNLGWDFLPLGSNLLDALHWPTIVGRFRFELGPAAALFLTDRHIICLADERSRSRFVKRDHINHGVIVTYFPRSRFSGFQIRKHNRFHILELQASGVHGAKSLQVRFPPEYEEKVVGLISKAAPTS
jgi:hypothetical protein